MKTIKVLELLEKRVSASIAREHYEDLTPPELSEQAREASKGICGDHSFPSSKGKPSRKQRRAMEEFYLRLKDSG